jgi:hypothetical protein
MIKVIGQSVMVKSSDFEIQLEFVLQTGKSNKNSIFTGLKRNSILINL